MIGGDYMMDVEKYLRPEAIEDCYEKLAAAVAESMIDDYRQAYKKYLELENDNDKKKYLQYLNEMIIMYNSHFCWMATTKMDFDDVAKIIERQEEKLWQERL